MKQVEKRIERSSNIELLRIAATLGVILFHYKSTLNSVEYRQYPVNKRGDEYDF